MSITVHEATRLAQLSYLPSKTAKLKAKEDGFSNPVFFNVRDTQCLCVEKGDELACAFRGTEPHSIQDRIGNLDAKKVDSQFGPGAIHRGFCNELEVVWPEISDYLNLSNAANWVGSRRIKKRVHFIGHSKGGALANIAALRMLYHHRKKTSLWTYGAPRCMTAKAAAVIEHSCPVYRFVNYADPVPWFPRGWWGFKHAGPALYFREWNKDMIEDPPYAMLWWDAVSQLVKNVGCWRKLADKYHPMSYYMMKIAYHFD